MKAYINQSGKLVLTPESYTELYALRQWKHNESFLRGYVVGSDIELHAFFGDSIVIEDISKKD